MWPWLIAVTRAQREREGAGVPHPHSFSERNSDEDDAFSEKKDSSEKGRGDLSIHITLQDYFSQRNCSQDPMREFEFRRPYTGTPGRPFTAAQARHSDFTAVSLVVTKRVKGEMTLFAFPFSQWESTAGHPWTPSAFPYPSEPLSLCTRAPFSIEGCRVPQWSYVTDRRTTGVSQLFLLASGAP